MKHLADLREILRYVPQYRDKCFVIALDGAIVEDEHFRNLLMDVFLLRSLRIDVVLVHGAGHQITRLAEQMQVAASNLDGTGVTDEATMQLALTASNRVSHEILEGLAIYDLRGAVSNALVAHPAGILAGVDFQYTGRVERVDTEFLRSLMKNDIIPIVPPLGLDGEGNTYRLNSDAAAVEVAKALSAVKLIYLTTVPGVMVDDGNGTEPRLLRQLKATEAEAILKKPTSALAEPSRSKLANAVKAMRGGVPRVHILDGRVDEGILAEVFSNDGIGTLVHANEYQAIRPARRKDARSLAQLIRASIENEELLPRSLAEIERTIGDFYIFEVDGNLAGCIALHAYPESRQSEMACLCVAGKYENQGIGARLMQFVEEQARAAGHGELFCLSTQAVNYFVQKGNFRPATPDLLPPVRRQRYEASKRGSRVLVKPLS